MQGVPLVQGGHLRFEHDRVLFRQAKSAGVGGGVEGGVLLQAYLIIVTDAADAVSVNFSGRCKFLQI